MLSSCVKTEAQNNKAIKKPIVKIKQTPSLFTGSYEGLSGGKNVAIVLTAKDSKLTGSLLMNGESAQITGLFKVI